MSREKFLPVKLGQVVATRGALDSYPAEWLMECVSRHASGDWGDVSEGDKQANDAALGTNDRLVSAFHRAEGEGVLIITEWDRSATTVLLPSEY